MTKLSNPKLLTTNYQLLTIVGPTASGKSGLAMRIAKEFNGEIICADSRTVYKGMDIGTAKPSVQDQKDVRHLGLDLVEPGDRFTAAKFKQYAQQAIDDIRSRDKLPMVVGGTGLYIDGLLYDFDFRPDIDEVYRQELEELTVEQLQQMIEIKGHQMPVNQGNKRHLIRVIETEGSSSKKAELMQGAYIFGILPPDEILKQRIDQRVEQMFKDGLVDETRRLVSEYGDEFKKTAGIGYSICCQLIDGEITEVKTKELFKSHHWQYARRQKTWFKRNPDIRWFENAEDAYAAIKAVVD